MLGFAGFWRLALREWRTGLGEIHRSLRKAAFYKLLHDARNRLKKSLDEDGLTPAEIIAVFE
jgi:hypothetical protein